MLCETTTPSTSRLVSVAEVLDTDHANRMLLLRVTDGDTDATGWAQLAIPTGFVPQTGDQVVVAGALSGEAFIIGCLTAAQNRMTTAQGAFTEIVRNSNGDDTLRVMTAGNELLFEFNPSTGSARLNVPEGSLEVTTPRGHLTFRAQGSIRLEGETVELRARQKLLLKISQGMAVAATRLRMLPGRIQVASQQANVSAAHFDLKGETANITCREISMASSQHDVKTEHLHTTAETVTERVGNVYRTVRDLIQLQAGRYRTYISGLSHFRSKRAFFSSEESMNIDGDQVNIG